MIVLSISTAYAHILIFGIRKPTSPGFFCGFKSLAFFCSYSFVGLSEGCRDSLGEIYESALAGTVNAGPRFDASS